MYIKKLGSQFWWTNVGTLKIDDTALVIYSMIVTNFFLQNKYGRNWSFEETFLVTNTKMEVVLGMFFLSLSDVDVRFGEKELEWRKYIITKALLTKKRIKFVNYKEFAIITLYPKKEVFVIHVTLLRV